MVNVIDNGARKRANMMPVGIKIVDDKGNVAYTAKTDLGTNYISLESKWFGSSSNNTGGSTGGNTGGNTDHPTVGADYYPGSVYDGTVSGRTLLYSGVTSTTGKTNVVLPESVGAGLALLGDGIQYRVSMSKTLITRGVKGDTKNIPLVYDAKDQKIAGSYVTISPLPVSNKKEDLISGLELVTPFNGIGEDDGSDEIKAPEIHVQYDSKTNSINAWGVQGYALDNLSDTKTGSLYDVQVTLINSFYVQNPVAQLPADMILFTGDTSGEAILSGTNSYFENLGEAIRIDLEKYLYINVHDPTKTQDTVERSLLSNFGIPSFLIVSKDDLINGYSVPLNANIPSSITTISVQTQSTYAANTTWNDTTWSSVNGTSVPLTVTSPSFLINGSSITPRLKITYETPVPNSPSNMIVYTGTLRITSIKTAKAGE